MSGARRVAAQRQQKQVPTADHWLLICAVLLLAIGLVMMSSASVAIAQNLHGDPFYHLKRQVVFLMIGLCASGVVLVLPLEWWRRAGLAAYLLALGLLVLVLVPGIGHEVNGSMRWINLGFMNVQASEAAKLLLVVSLASLVSARAEWIRHSWTGFLGPLLMMGPPVLLLLLEPDFGAAVVLLIAVFGMLFLAGVALHRFVLLSLLAGGGAVAMVLSSDYRRARVESFIQALSDPFHEDVVFGAGYQLAQALIAFGRGEWLGVGLGNSIQKLYFLPEAHTDFVLAIFAEELGFLSVLALIALFLAFVCRALMVGRRSERQGDLFAALLAYGIAILFAAQIVINIAVNVGLAPTKGLTLPFLSYGGSSLIICLVMVALLVRIDLERCAAGGAARGRRT